jgi:hypothetical protein
MNPDQWTDNEVILLTRDGIWMADGEEISHEPTRKLFARSLKHDAEGYFLSIGRETKRIEVEDTAYFVHRIEGNHTDGFEIWLSDETRERLKPESLIYRPGRLSCKIKNGSEEAKFQRTPYIEILRAITEETGKHSLEIAGKKIQLD